MTLHLGMVAPGSTIYIPFDTFAGSTGASITMTGLAVGDILIYKNGGTTQRGSTTGFTLLDTDGIDFDAITGIHGLSIDLSSNATADFFTAGASYWVVISTITVDAQTVSFVLATFSIGYTDAIVNTTIATLATQTSFTLTAGPAEDDALNGCTVVIHDIASAVQLGKAVVNDYTGSTKTVTLVAGVTFTAAAGDNISIFLPVLQPTVWGRTFDVSATGEGGLDWANIGSPTTAQNLSATNIDVDQIVASVSGAVGSVTARVTANVDQLNGGAQSLLDLKDFADDGYDPSTNKVQGVVLTDTLTTYTGDTPQTGDSFARIGATGSGLTTLATQASVNTIDDFLDTEIAAIKAVTDALPNAGALTTIQADLDNIQTRLPAALTTGTSDSGSTTTMVDSARTEADTDYWKGCWIRFTSGNISGQVRLITGFTPASDTITFAPATTQAVATQDYEILPANRVDLGQWLGSTPNALVSSRVDVLVGAMASDVLTAASLNADAVTEIQSGLATGAALDTVDNFLDTEIAAIISTLGTPAGASVSADILTIDNLVDDLESRLGTPSNLGSGATVAANLADIESQTDDIGTAGAGLTAILWNAAWDAEVQSEVDDALVARNLDKLVIVSGTADSGSTTTMVDAARTEADNDYWKGRVILFTSGNISGECAIITDFVAATDTFTLAPPLTQAVATQNYVILPGISAWDDTLAEHLISGSTGAALNAAGAAGDPWSTALPGVYGAGTAGKIVGDNVNATISSRASQTSLDTLDDYVDTEVAAIKAKTDQLTFTTANQVDAGVLSIATNAITADSIASNAIGSAEIADGAITAAKIATDAIDADALADGAITAATFAAGAIDATAIAADAIGSSELAASAVTEIQAGLSTLTAAQVNTEVDTALADARLDELLAADSDIDGAAPPTVGSVFHELLTKTAGSFTYDQTTDSLEAVRDRGDAAWTTATGFSTLTQADVRTATGLASANLDTQLTTIDDFLDTEIAAIKAKTDNLPSDPADASDITSSFTTVNGKLDTIDDFLDTEIAAIKAKTDSLTFTTALQVDANALAIDSSTSAATHLKDHALVAVPVTFAAGGTTTTAILVNVDGAAASSTDDFYNGRVLIFTAPSGLKYQATDITDYVGATKTATITAVTTAPVATATAIMV